LLEQLAGCVVDGRDVVGVESVAEPEGVGQSAQGEEGRMPGAVGEEAAEADDVEEHDRAVEATEAPALAAVEAAGHGLDGRRHQDPPPLPRLPLPGSPAGKSTLGPYQESVAIVWPAGRRADVERVDSLSWIDRKSDPPPRRGRRSGHGPEG